MPEALGEGSQAGSWGTSAADFLGDRWPRSQGRPFTVEELKSRCQSPRCDPMQEPQPSHMIGGSRTTSQGFCLLEPVIAGHRVLSIVILILRCHQLPQCLFRIAGTSHTFTLGPV